MARNLYFKAGIGMYADAGSVVPTIPGTGIHWWKDETSGSGQYSFQFSELNRPLHIVDLESYTAVCINYWRPDSQGDDRPLNLNVSYPFNRRSFTGLLVFQMNTVRRRSQLMAFGSFGAQDFTVTVEHGYLYIKDGATGINHATGLLVSSQKSVVVVRCSATEVTIHLNTIENSFTLPPFTAGSFTGGEIAGSLGGWFNCYLVDYYDNDIGVSAAMDLMEEAREEWDIRTEHSKFIMVDGDTITEGFGVVENKPYWRKLGIPKYNNLLSHGLALQLADAALAEFMNYNVFAGIKQSKWIMLRFAVSGTMNGQQLFDHLMNYFNIARLRGVQRGIFFTLNMHSQEASRDQANALLRAAMPYQRGENQYVFRDASDTRILIDVARHPLIGSASPLDPVYWLDDFHTTDSSHQITSSMIQEGVPELFELDTVASPYQPIAAHIGQGVVQINTNFLLESGAAYEPLGLEEFKEYEVEASMELDGEYKPFSNNRFSSRDGFIYNFPLGETAYLRIRSISTTGATSEWTQIKLGVTSRPVIEMACRAVRGSIIPAGALFVAPKEQQRIIGFMAVEDITFS